MLKLETFRDGVLWVAVLTSIMIALSVGVGSVYARVIEASVKETNVWTPPFCPQR